MLKNIKPDKWRHFYVGVAMGLLFEGVLLQYVHFSVLTSTLVAFFLVVVLSYGFELTSLITKRGHYDVLDAVAGIVGGIAGMVIMLVLCLQ